MIYWAQLLHFYQPPTQSPGVLRKICDESYRPLIRVLLQYPHAQLTVNINGVLVEMLHECGHDDVIKGLVQLVYKPQGFSPPELSYSRELVSPVLSSGHNWLILSGSACPNSRPVDVIHYIEEGDKKLMVFFRDDALSNKISFQIVDPSEFLNSLKQNKGNKEKIYIVTAMDAETFGHHIQNWEELFLAEVYEQIEPSVEVLASLKQATALAHQYSLFLEDSKVTQEVQAVSISQLLKLFPLGEEIEPRPCHKYQSS